MSVIPHSIRLKLDEVRETLRGYLWQRCLLMIACWILLIFWLGAAVDYLPVRIGASETSQATRVGMLILMAAGVVWFLLGWLLPRWLTRVRDSSLALLIEKHNPGLANELVTAVEVCGQELSVADPNAHEAMLQRVFAEAEQSVSGINIESLFNWRPIRILRLQVIFGLVATSIVAVMYWSWFSQWSQRLFALSDQPWPRQAVLKADFLQIHVPTFTGQLIAEQLKLEFRDNLVHVPRGASLLLQISADATARRVPETCTLYYRSEDGVRGRANLRRIGRPVSNWQQFQLDGPPLDNMNSNLELDIVGLDARLRNLKLHVVDRVVITDLNLDCQYPKYLMDSLSVRAERESVPYRAGLKIPEGTECTVVGRCNAELQEVQYTIRSTTTSDSQGTAEILKATVDGTVFRFPLGMLRESRLVEIRLIDRHGLPSEQVHRYNVTITPDLVPEVQSRLEGIGLAITSRAMLPVRGTIIDDHAVSTVLAEVSVDETSIPPIPLQLVDRKLEGDVDFVKLAESGTVILQPGMTIGLNVVAKDYYDLSEGEHVGRGQPVQLAVVSPDQLLVLLDRNELELRQRLEQIISELSQLKDALRNLAESLTEIQPPSSTMSPNKRFTFATFDPTTMILATTMIDASGGPTNFLIANWQTQEVLGELPDGSKAAAKNRAGAQDTHQAMLRLAVLRAQQAQLQTDKSRQELAGVVNRIQHLRLQLVNNRIDSLDRQERLLEQVQNPLARLLRDDYVGLEKLMSELQSATMSGNGRIQASLAADSLDKILVALEAIKSSMMDIESFNELIDLVRGLLEEQERVLKETQDIQKSRVLDLLK